MSEVGNFIGGVKNKVGGVFGGSGVGKQIGGGVVDYFTNGIGGMSDAVGGQNWSSWGQGAQGVWGNIVGTGGNTGPLGTGQFTTDMYQPNAAAFGPNAQEQQYIASLQNRAYGSAPSAAQLQMNQGLQQATAQSNALAASQRGISPALAARYAAMNQAGMSQRMNADQAILRAQEQERASGMLGNELQSVRTGQMGLENLRSGNYNYAQELNQKGYSDASKTRNGNIMNMLSKWGSSGGGGGGGGGGGDMGGGGGGGMMSLAAAYGGEIPDPASFNNTPRLSDDKDKSDSDSKDPLGLSSLFAKGGEVPKGPRSHTARMMKPQGLAFGGSPFDMMPAPRFPQMPVQQQPAPLPPPRRPPPMGWGMAGKQGVPFGPGLQRPPQMMANKNPNPMPAAAPMAAPQPMLRLPADFGRMFGGPGNRAFDKGGTVPGDAKVSGDSLKNDKVPAMLSPKEIVLPRSVTMHPDAPRKAAEFVAAVKARSKKK